MAILAFATCTLGGSSWAGDDPASSHPLPGLRRLMDTPLRDTSICRGAEGTWYLTGTVYFLWHSGKIARMTPDLSGLAEPYRWLKTRTSDPNAKHHSGLCAGIFGTNSFDHVGFEGMFIFKANGRYHLACAESFEGRYSCMIATSTSLFGPYGARYEAIPHGGHNMFFQDEKGRWWSTYFGSDDQAPWRERAGVLPIAFDAEGRVHPANP